MKRHLTDYKRVHIHKDVTNIPGQPYTSLSVELHDRRLNSLKKEEIQRNHRSERIKASIALLNDT